MLIIVVIRDQIAKLREKQKREAGVKKIIYVVLKFQDLMRNIDATSLVPFPVSLAKALLAESEAHPARDTVAQVQAEDRCGCAPSHRAL